jgi:hypothetical protein
MNMRPFAKHFRHSKIKRDKTSRVTERNQAVAGVVFVDHGTPERSFYHLLTNSPPYSVNLTIRTVVSTKNKPSQSLASTFSKNFTLEARLEPKKQAGRMTLNTLPYDLLLNIATRLDIQDVHALHLVSVSHVCLRSVGVGVEP